MMTTRSTRHSVLIVGSLNMDLVLELPRMPQLGETLVGNRHSKIPGGKGANQAIGIARLGATVTLVGKVRKDDNGDELVALLSQ